MSAENDGRSKVLSMDNPPEKREPVFMQHKPLETPPPENVLHVSLGLELPKPGTVLHPAAFQCKTVPRESTATVPKELPAGVTRLTPTRGE
ncbi:MAG: hypothetical protein ACYCZ0_00230 [Minisyncoccota bacterium]